MFGIKSRFSSKKATAIFAAAAVGGTLLVGLTQTGEAQAAPKGCNKAVNRVNGIPHYYPNSAAVKKGREGLVPCKGMNGAPAAPVDPSSAMSREAASPASVRAREDAIKKRAQTREYNALPNAVDDIDNLNSGFAKDNTCPPSYVLKPFVGERNGFGVPVGDIENNSTWGYQCYKDRTAFDRLHPLNSY